MKTSQDIVSCYPVNHMWTSRGEGIHVRWDEGQIMKVIDLKKQAKNSRFYSLVLFTRPHEKP